MTASIHVLPEIPARTPIWVAAVDAPRLALPLMQSRVPAGFESPANDYLEGVLDLNEKLIEHPAATFIFQLDSQGIQPGRPGLAPWGLHHHRQVAKARAWGRGASQLQWRLYAQAALPSQWQHSALFPQ